MSKIKYISLSTVNDMRYSPNVTNEKMEEIATALGLTSTPILKELGDTSTINEYILNTGKATTGLYISWDTSGKVLRWRSYYQNNPADHDDNSISFDYLNPMYFWYITGIDGAFFGFSTSSTPSLTDFITSVKPLGEKKGTLAYVKNYYRSNSYKSVTPFDESFSPVLSLEPWNWKYKYAEGALIFPFIFREPISETIYETSLYLPYCLQNKTNSSNNNIHYTFTMNGSDYFLSDGAETKNFILKLTNDSTIIS